MQEQWKPVKGYEGLYEVSNLGRVKSLPRRTKSELTHPRAVPGRIMSASKNKHCSTVNLCKDGESCARAISHLVQEAFDRPAPSENHVARHLDGDNSNCRLDNLAWVSKSQMCLEAKRKTTIYDNGRVSPRTGLDEHKVAQIIIRYAKGERNKTLAREFGISSATCTAICKGRTWKGVREQIRQMVAARKAQLDTQPKVNP